jgi:hypothetical protein
MVAAVPVQVRAEKIGIGPAQNREITLVRVISRITGTVVTDSLPASAHFDSAAATQGSCTRTPSGPPMTKGGTVSCTAGSLAAGASVTVTITVTPTTPGTVSDNASVTASNVTADPDDSASASTTVYGT